MKNLQRERVWEYREGYNINRKIKADRNRGSRGNSSQTGGRVIRWLHW